MICRISYTWKYPQAVTSGLESSQIRSHNTENGSSVALASETHVLSDAVRQIAMDQYGQIRGNQG